MNVGLLILDAATYVIPLPIAVALLLATGWVGYRDLRHRWGMRLLVVVVFLVGYFSALPLIHRALGLS